MLHNLLPFAGIENSVWVNSSFYYTSVLRGATDSLVFKKTKGRCAGKILKTL